MKNLSKNAVKKTILDQSKCFFDSKFGFRPHHSTNHALITKHIRSVIDKNNLTCGVFLDFQKTFDTVNHGILLSKIKLVWCLVCGITHDFLKSYLTNRKQHIIRNAMSSSILSITYEVLQRSVLGPVLFLIYINDLNHMVKQSTVHYFDDGNNLLYSSYSLKSKNYV